jgi:hypothetical protein
MEIHGHLIIRKDKVRQQKLDSNRKYKTAAYIIEFGAVSG